MKGSKLRRSPDSTRLTLGFGQHAGEKQTFGYPPGKEKGSCWEAVDAVQTTRYRRKSLSQASVKNESIFSAFESDL